jgi:hypothetical protein
MAWTDDTVRSVPQSLARTFTFSLATAQIGTNDLPVTGLAVSARASLFSGKLSRAAVGRLGTLDSMLATAASQFERRLEQQRGQAEARLVERLSTASTPQDSAAAKEEFIATVAALAKALAVAPDFVEERHALESQFQDLALTRDGFFLEVAGGAVWSAPRAVIDSASFDRWGVWMTASYALPNLSFAGVVRWLGEDDPGVQDAIDFGGRFIYARDRYALSLEYVGRHRSGDGDAPDGWRFAGVIDYEIRPALWLTGTFGRDYDDLSEGSLLARLGLSLNLSDERYGKGERE